MTTRRRFIAGALATPLIGRAGSAFSQGLTKIVIAQPSAGFNYLPVYVARGMGMFKEEGLDVDVVVFERGASAALTAVLGGEATAYVGLPAIPLQAHAKGQRTKIFGALYNQWGSEIVLSGEVAAHAGVKSSMSNKEKAAALRGLKIAVAGAGSITDLLVRHVSRFGGLDPERDLTIIPIGGGANMLAAFTQKKIDGYSLSSPTSTIGIANMGGVNLFDFSRGEYEPLRGLLYTAVSARDEWLNTDGETARRLLRSLWRAQIAMHDRPGEAKASITESFSKIDKTVIDLAWNAILPGFDKSLVVTPDGIARNYEFLRAVRGELATSPIPETYTNAFVQAVEPTL
jgi:NitT/TauT family transport system substrate-binding protein